MTQDASSNAARSGVDQRHAAVGEPKGVEGVRTEVESGGHGERRQSRYLANDEYRRLFLRLLSGRLQNVAFSDLERLVVGFWFKELRTRAATTSTHPAVDELLNLQPLRGTAKPYQIRQLLHLIERYDLGLADEA